VDVVFNSLPITKETAGVFTEEVFRGMQSHVVFVNVGRGSTVDENALIKALREGWIAFAGLDVFNVEPLEESSVFYNEGLKEKVLVSNHSMDKTDDSPGVRAGVFVKNWERYRKDGSLVTLVDRELGY